MTIASRIRQERQEQGLTQVELAAQAGVSLPALQQLEAGASNPSLETIARLGRILGFEVTLESRACDWERLIALGLPMMAKRPPLPAAASEAHLVRELRLALRERGDDRRQEALAGLLLAIAEYFPSVYTRSFRKHPRASELIARPDGRVIKLKRLAASRISEYL